MGKLCISFSLIECNEIRTEQESRQSVSGLHNGVELVRWAEGKDSAESSGESQRLAMNEGKYERRQYSLPELFDDHVE